MVADPLLLLRIFQTETRQQCRYALTAFEELQAACTAADEQRTWYAMQAFLVAAGNISKLLWPPKPPTFPAVRQQLRDSLRVQDNSPLANRDLRNDFEHFDERLEAWAVSAEDPDRHFYIDRVVGPGLSHALVGPRAFRLLDRGTWVVSFRGREYPLLPVVSAIRDLLLTMEKELRGPARGEDTRER